MQAMAVPIIGSRGYAEEVKIDLLPWSVCWLVLASTEWGGPMNGKQRAKLIGGIFNGFHEWSYVVAGINFPTMKAD